MYSDRLVAGSNFWYPVIETGVLENPPICGDIDDEKEGIIAPNYPIKVILSVF
jgi:hypothetical protein